MPTTASIVGREAELAALVGFLRDQHGPAIAFVGGEAGVGKTSLLSASAIAAADDGARVLWARPTQAEASSSYAALDDLIRPALSLLPRLAEPQRRALAGALQLDDAAEPVEPRLVSLACLSLLEALAQPVLLAVDDWQWLDAASAAVLSFTLRRLSGTAKLIATVRSGEGDEVVAALIRSLRDGDVLEMTLSALDAEALRQLVHEASGKWLSPPALGRLALESGGNPLVALELVREPGAGSAIDIRRLLGRRIAALTIDARAVLRFTAAMAEPTPEKVELVVDNPEAVRHGLEEALAAGILERDDERLRFTHPLLAAVVAQRSPPSEWRSIHARLAGLADNPEQRARHLAAAATAPDATVATALEDASRLAVARGALGAAAELAERATELTPDSDESALVRRLLAAADAHIASVDGQRARTLLEDVVNRVSAGPLRAQALHRLVFLVDFRSGIELGERALSQAGDDDRLLADIHISISSLEESVHGTPRALGHAESALVHADRSGEPMLRAEALANLAWARWMSGAGVQRDLLMRAAELERCGGRRQRDDTPLLALAIQLQAVGELDEARRLCGAELQRAVGRGRLDHELMALGGLSWVELRAGRWQLADSYARQALEMSLGFGFWNAETMGHCSCAEVDAHLGRVESARSHAEAGLSACAEWGDLIWSIICGRIIGFLELSLGDAPAAVKRLSPLPAQARRLSIGEPAEKGFAPDLAEALILTGDLNGARAIQVELEQEGRALGRTWAIASSLRCRGLIASAERRSQDAVADLEEALEAHAGLPQPFDRARTLMALGTVQRRAKQRAEARSSLEQALAMFQELGAELWSNKASAEIARLGGRRARHSDELTESEHRIAELAAQGRSNREIAGELFVSERTVEANLTRAYRKLGVRSRTELARRLPAE